MPSPCLLSSKSGVKQVATFCTEGFAQGPNIPTIRYVTRLCRRSPVMALEKEDAYVSIATLDKLYNLHLGHSLNASISKLEVRDARVHCPNCMSTTQFTLAISPASTAQAIPSTTSCRAITLPASDFCYNEAIFVSCDRFNLREDAAIDTLLIGKAEAPNTKENHGGHESGSCCCQSQSLPCSGLCTGGHCYLLLGHQPAAWGLHYHH